MAGGAHSADQGPGPRACFWPGGMRTSPGPQNELRLAAQEVGSCWSLWKLPGPGALWDCRVGSPASPPPTPVSLHSGLFGGSLLRLPTGSAGKGPPCALPHLDINGFLCILSFSLCRNPQLSHVDKETEAQRGGASAQGHTARQQEGQVPVFIWPPATPRPTTHNI